MANVNLTVKHGKFFRGNDEVPMQFGDRDQIALLDKVRDWQENGFYPEVRVVKKISMEFRCVCGALNDLDCFDDLDIDDPDTMIAGNQDSCHYCGLEFEVFEDEWGDLALKLLDKKK